MYACMQAVSLNWKWPPPPPHSLASYVCHMLNTSNASPEKSSLASVVFLSLFLLSMSSSAQSKIRSRDVTRDSFTTEIDVLGYFHFSELLSLIVERRRSRNACSQFFSLSCCERYIQFSSMLLCVHRNRTDNN